MKLCSSGDRHEKLQLFNDIFGKRKSTTAALLHEYFNFCLQFLFLFKYNSFVQGVFFTGTPPKSS